MALQTHLQNLRNLPNVPIPPLDLNSFSCTQEFFLQILPQTPPSHPQLSPDPITGSPKLPPSPLTPRFPHPQIPYSVIPNLLGSTLILWFPSISESSPGLAALSQRFLGLPGGLRRLRLPHCGLGARGGAGGTVRCCGAGGVESREGAMGMWYWRDMGEGKGY